jgi:hypothetical protein
MVNALFQFVRKNPPSICFGGGIHFGLMEDLLPAATIIILGAVLYAR